MTHITEDGKVLVSIDEENILEDIIKYDVSIGRLKEALDKGFTLYKFKKGDKVRDDKGEVLKVLETGYPSVQVLGKNGYYREYQDRLTKVKEVLD